MKYEKKPAPNLKAFSTPKLIELWETTGRMPWTVEMPTVRGWLMDEIQRREPERFDEWLSQDEPADETLRKFILDPA